ncbi:hypothetical protein QUF74_07135 [Candidatus Halobeggiatoa sp. HSG11]|nr:hypothetical protein [Candidatus Halobeggiatoa sp. HSG11]
MKYIFFLIIISICNFSWAATIIKSNEMGQEQKIFLDGKHVRMESNSYHYTLVDLDAKKIYMVNTKDKLIISGNITGIPIQLPPEARRNFNQQPIKAELVKIGNGPEIVGYSTVNYQINALGKKCFDSYFSKDFANVAHVKDFVNLTNKVFNSRKIRGVPVHPCQQAVHDLNAKTRKLGVLMKSMVSDDKIKHEITSVKVDADIKPDMFKLPNNYKVLTEAKILEEQQKAMMKHKPSHIPNQ